MFAAESRSIAVGRQAVSELARLALRSVAENLVIIACLAPEWNSVLSGNLKRQKRIPVIALD